MISTPSTEIAPRIWDLIDTHGAERIARSGFTFHPSARVGPPFVAEATAYFECRHRQTVDLDDGEVFIFGTVVAAGIAETCQAPDLTVGYHRLGPAFFLEAGLYAPMGRPMSVRP